MSTAVLVLAFNRPDVLRRMLQSLLAARPTIVYINIDGPRSGFASDEVAVRKVRQLIDKLEWPCPVEVRTHNVNLGLDEGVMTALDWFFSSESEGIVLEDDVLIEPTSLALASELLKSFRQDQSVGSISLFNPVPLRHLSAPEEDAWFSRIVSTQYWGTWSDRWHSLTPTFEHWEEKISREKLVSIGGPAFADFLIPAWREEVKAGGANWEGKWMATHWLNNWRVVTTTMNYCLHIGFSSEASNSHEQPSWYPTTVASWRNSVELRLPINVDRPADLWRVNQRYGLSRPKRMKRWIGRRLPWLRQGWRFLTVRPIK